MDKIDPGSYAPSGTGRKETVMTQPQPPAQHHPTGQPPYPPAPPQQPGYYPPQQQQPYMPPPGYKLKKKRHPLRWIFGGIAALIVLIVIISAAASSGGNSNGGVTSNKEGVSSGLGTRDASGDVTFTKTLHYDVIGVASFKVTVTNHSSKRSDYVIDFALQSPNGKRQLDRTTVLVSDLDPGQANTQRAEFLQLNGHAPAGYKIVLKTVQRNESF